MKALALLKKTFSLLVIFTCSFQMAFAETIARMPASEDEYKEAKELQEKIFSFAVLVNGKSLADQAKANMNMPAQADASQNNSFFQTLEDLKNTGESLWFEPENSEEEQKSDEGIVSSIKESVLALEKEDEKVVLSKEQKARLKVIYKNSKEIKNKVIKFLESDQIDELKQIILISYVGSVLMPMRDLALLEESMFKSKSAKKVFDKLNIGFDSELFPEDNLDLRDKLRFGINNMSDMMYHNIEESALWGSARLTVDKFKMLDRDIVTLLKVPTVENYLRAARILTIKMMAQQMATYKAILGDYSPVELPKSCQLPKNGAFPATVDLEFDKGLGKEYVRKLLENHGLVRSTSDEDLSDMYLEYYMERAELNPLEDGYSGLLPFESYDIAQKALSDKRADVALDDVKDFEDALNIRARKLEKVFTRTIKTTFERTANGQMKKIEGRSEVHKAQAVFSKIIRNVTEAESYSFDNEGTEEVIDHMNLNLTKFLAEMLVEKKSTDVVDLISPKLEKELKNREVVINFPSLYGASLWRNWALRNLANLVEANIDAGRKSTVYKAFSRSCNRRKDTFCRTKGNILKKVSKVLKPYVHLDEFIPLQRAELAKLERVYPYFRKVWNRLRKDADTYSFLKTNEYDLLVNQVEMYNPWAKVRLGYLLAQDELTNAKKNGAVDYFYHRFGSYLNKNGANFNVIEMKNKLAEAAEVMGIDRVFNAQYSNNILSAEEKEELWKTRAEALNQKGDQNTLTDGVNYLEDVTKDIFSTTDLNGKKTYKMLYDVSYATLLSRERVENLTTDKLETGLSGDAWDSINDILDSEFGVRSEFFLDLYKFEGSVDDKLDFFEEHAYEFGIQSEYDVKEQFLALDTELKKPIYDYLTKRASIVKKNAIKYALGSFCNIEDDNVEGLQDVFYATTKAQSVLNEKADFVSVPENVTDKMSSMTPADWTDLKLGLGMGGLTMAALMLASTGVGAPLGAALFLASTGATGLQITMANREINHIYKADKRVERVKLLEDLGLTEAGSSDNVARGWGWAAFEVVSIIPVLGLAAAFTKSSVKMITATGKIYTRQAVKNGMKLRRTRKAAKELTDQAGKTITAESEVEVAKNVLGFNTIGKDIESVKDVRKAIGEIHKSRRLYKEGKITASEMTKRISDSTALLKNKLTVELTEEGAYKATHSVANLTEKMINNQTAKVTAELFDNNPTKLNSLMKSYTTKMFGKADRLAYAKGVMRNVNNGKFGKVKSYLLKMRYENLAKNGAKIRKITKELDQLAKNGGDLEAYILKNIDTFTGIFRDVSMRKRELPYVVLFQGGPHLGFRAPVFGSMSDGIVLRKVFTARTRLLSEKVFAENRELLGMKGFVAYNTTYDFIRNFTTSAADAVVGSADPEMMAKLYQYEQELGVAVANSLAENANKNREVLGELNKLGGDREILKVLFTPVTTKEIKLSKKIWMSIDLEKILNMNSIEGLAYEVAKKIDTPKNMDEFDRLVKALKILSLKRSEGKVEIL